MSSTAQLVVDELVTVGFEEVPMPVSYTHLDVYKRQWKPIVDADIAGDTSTANVVDSDIKILGKSMATKRAARCVFLGTAPLANLRQRDGSSAPMRGIEQKRVILGSTYPGDNPAHIADGLRRLGDLGKYMRCV